MRKANEQRLAEGNTESITKKEVSGELLGQEMVLLKFQERQL